MVVPGLIGLILVPSPVVRAFVAGALIATAAMALVGWVVVASGSAGAVMGEAAEQWTAAELRPLSAQAWRMVNHVPFGRVDIDHLLIGPGGVYVVETKWSGAGWGDRWALDRIDTLAAGVASQAARARRWPPVRNLRLGAVTPVLVLWGRSVPNGPITHERNRDRPWAVTR